MTEPHWISVTTMGSSYEAELDVNSREPRYRHRPKAFTGEFERDWIPGAPPAHRPTAAAGENSPLPEQGGNAT